MIAQVIRNVMIPVALVATVAACDPQYGGGPVQPGYVQTSTYGSAYPSGYRGEAGRVMAIREVGLRQSGVNDGTLIGGGLGAAGGAIAGAAISNTVGGAVVGGVLGGVGGAIAGTAIEGQRGRRGIEVTIQRDDGQQVTIAQPDNGDVQMGDRVIIVYDRNGVARAVRDTNRGADRV